MKGKMLNRRTPTTRQKSTIQSTTQVLLATTLVWIEVETRAAIRRRTLLVV
jgi:hypothetical protein